MSPEQRRYLILQSGVGAAIVNAVINGGFGWLITRGLLHFPMWQIPGAAADLLATAFGVTFGTCIGLAFQVPRDVAKNKVSLPVLPAGLAGFLARFPVGALKRSIWLGMVSVPLFGVPLLVVLAATGQTVLERSTFIFVKAGFAAFQAAIVTPLLVLAVLLELSRTSPAPSAERVLSS